MSIQKDKIINGVVVGNYWKISLFYFDTVAMSLRVQISLWTDQTTGQARTPPLGVNKIKVLSVTEDESKGDLRALAYTKIKALNDPDLFGGVDV